MRLANRSGGAAAAGVAPGGLVMLIADEPGDFGTAKAGDWGKVVAVDGDGLLTILLAGYSLPPSAALRSISDISPRIVTPCDSRGQPTGAAARKQWETVNRYRR
ncbi:hypothetical protein JYK14_24265 [Siccirubricoccus sp. KC 17139]|uniref:Uncharacterized protein n=1 Tax=Siccirubricoccus soli TaxID=2899147 RepID=A0ABT1DBE1_9PROT|nr:hypothetical protein [Siccirubricoccus soli]MCO6419251.1 hypothetical protein [Siccirubricoccus soli]MCP2685386.1 hypothetical protein [Siccirubricoccus soli]